jgi:ferredoxin hydrogenase large subunit
MSGLSEIIVIKRKVLKELATLAWQDRMKEIDSLPRKLTNDGITNYRCCEYRERAILTDRIKLGMGAILEENDDVRLSSLVKDLNTLKNREQTLPIVSIIEKACDRCPIDKMVVTNACRNCVAHNCLNACPRKAIEIVNNRAYINKELCVECGLCVKACRFGAILEIERPCSRACAVGAISPGENSSAKIDHEKCVECGACIAACPFGAISDRSEILQVIAFLKAESFPTKALVAPSIAGQFGPMVDWSRLVSGLKKLGFSEVIPVALGADQVGKEESQELRERQTEGEALFNSCCPSFKNLIEKNFSSLATHLSKTKSPMLVTAEMVRKADPNAKTVFIGPCLAKKGEAKRSGIDLIDAVLTFEELAAILVAAEINLAECKPVEEKIVGGIPSARGINFARSGGVMRAVTGDDQGAKVKSISASGIKECLELLTKVSKGIEAYDFVEGMGCEGGCIGGPGTLVNTKVAARALRKTTENKGEDQFAS